MSWQSRSGYAPWKSHDSCLATSVGESAQRPPGASPFRLHEARVSVRDRRRSGNRNTMCDFRMPFGSRFATGLGYKLIKLKSPILLYIRYTSYFGGPLNLRAPCCRTVRTGPGTPLGSVRCFIGVYSEMQIKDMMVQATQEFREV